MLYKLWKVLHCFSETLGDSLCSDLKKVSIGLLSRGAFARIAVQDSNGGLEELLRQHAVASLECDGALWRSQGGLEARFGRKSFDTVNRRQFFAEDPTREGTIIGFQLPY